MLIPDHDSFVSEISRFEVISWTNDRSCSRTEVLRRPLHTSQFIQHKRHSSFQHVTPCVWLACCTLAASDIAVYIPNRSCSGGIHLQCVEELVLFQRSSPAVLEDLVVQLKSVNWNQSWRRAVLCCVCLTQPVLFASFFVICIRGMLVNLSVKWPAVQC